MEQRKLAALIAFVVVGAATASAAMAIGAAAIVYLLSAVDRNWWANLFEPSPLDDAKYHSAGSPGPKNEPLGPVVERRFPRPSSRFSTVSVPRRKPVDLPRHD